MLLGVGVGIATTSVNFMAYCSSCAALTISFHSKKVLFGSGDSATLAQHTLSTLAINSIESFGMCILRVGFSANYMILRSDSSWSIKSTLGTPIRGLLDQKRDSSCAREKPNSTDTILLSSVQLKNDLVATWSQAKGPRSKDPRFTMANSINTCGKKELKDLSACSILEN